MGTGPLVGTLRFDVHSGWANVRQEMRGQRQECCAFSEHSGDPNFLKHSKVRSKTLETGWEKYTARCILIWCGFPFYNSTRFVDDSSHMVLNALQQPSGLFKNYADNTTGNSTSNFDDASSSALLAATVYRLALLTGNKTYVPEAERTRAAIFATNGTMASATFFPGPSSPTSTAQPPASLSTSDDAFANSPHFTADGWLSPVVDPLNIGVEGGMSPEGEAFALMLHAAWRDWSAAGSPGAPDSAPASLGRVRKFREGGVPVLAVAGLVVACTFGDLIV